MWDQIFKRWVDLFFWWLPRDEKGEDGARGATQERAEPAPEQAAEPEPEAAQATGPDDLTVIKGIGPAVQEKLRLLGITTFRDLAAANPDSLVDQLKASGARLQGAGPSLDRGGARADRGSGPEHVTDVTAPVPPAGPRGYSGI